MKRRLLYIAVMAMFLSFFTNFGVSQNSLAASAEKVITWKFQTAYPMTSGVTMHAVEWGKAMEKLTNGRLKVEVYPAGTFCSAAQMLTFLKRGTFDAAISYGGLYVGTIPEANLEACMTMAHRSHFEVWDFLYARGFIDVIQDSYAKHGVHYWPAPCESHYGIMTNYPIKSIKDVKGKKFRATGLMGKFLEKLGASVCVIPGSELYMAMKLGTIDGAIYGGGIFMSENLNEVVKCWVEYPYLGQTNGAFLVSQKSLDKLPADLKAIVENSTPYVLLESGNKFYKAALESVSQFEEKGVEVVRFPESEVKQMTAVAQGFWDELSQVNEACAKGVELLKQQMRDYGRLD